MRLWGLLALLVLAAIAPAAADHTYSHRYLLVVHVTADDGAPVPDHGVAAQWSFQHGGACAANPTAFGAPDGSVAGTTNASGVAVLCVHAHALPAAAQVTILADEARVSVTTPVDAGARVTWADVRLAAGASGAAVVPVHVRLWRAEPGVVEGIHVLGRTIADAPVNATLRFDTGEETRLAGRSDGYGDAYFEAAWPAGATNGTALLEAEGKAQTVTFDRARPLVAATLPDASPHASRATASAAGAGDGASKGPGDDRAVVPAPALLLVAVAAAAAGGLRRAR